MTIYVPSSGRHHADDVERGPLLQFPEHRLRETFLVVPENQRAAYELALSEFYGLESVRVLPCPEVGIAKTRHWIGLHAASEGIDRFCMVDDDVRFVVREAHDTVRLRQAEEIDVARMWDHVYLKLRDYAHVGVSARQGNNQLGLGGPHECAAVNTRTLRVLCYQTEKFLEVEHGRVAVMEDFDVNLQLLRRGYDNLNIGFWSQDQKMTNAPGGCSEYRDHAAHEAAALRLSELHPGFVMLREKQNKTGGEFGTRTEVTIFWKRARDDAR